jgi:LPXTG-site transpeptidase (sortase) family protein
MYRRHSSRNLATQIFGAGAILIGVIVIFMLYEKAQTPAPASVPPTQTSFPTAQPTVPPLPTVIVPASKQIRIVAAKAHINTSIVEVYYGRTENWDISKLGVYAGHLEGTSPVGEPGNSVLIGHIELRDATQGAFAHLDRLQKGDELSVIVTKGDDVKFIPYVVTELKMVSPDDMSVLSDHGYDELTLLTCYEWEPDTATYKSRLILQARPKRLPNSTMSSTVQILPPK